MAVTLKSSKIRECSTKTKSRHGPNFTKIGCNDTPYRRHIWVAAPQNPVPCAKCVWRRPKNQQEKGEPLISYPRRSKMGQDKNPVKLPLAAHAVQMWAECEFRSSSYQLLMPFNNWLSVKSGQAPVSYTCRSTDGYMRKPVKTPSATHTVQQMAE